MELPVLFTTLFVCHETVSIAVYQLKKKYDQDKLGTVPSEAFDTISFPLEDKHVVIEHHRMTPYRKNALTWYTSRRHMTGFKPTSGFKNVAKKGFLGVAVYWEE